MTMAAACYAGSLEHLLARMEPIDLLIRAQVARFRGMHLEDEQFRGLYVSEEQVDALLTAPLGMPAWLLAGRKDRALPEALACARRVSAKEDATLDANV